MVGTQKKLRARAVTVLLPVDTWTLLGKMLVALNFERIRSHEPSIDLPTVVISSLETFLADHADEILERYGVTVAALTRATIARHLPDFIPEIAGATGLDPTDLCSDIDRTGSDRTDHLVRGAGGRCQLAFRGLRESTRRLRTRTAAHHHGLEYQEEDTREPDSGREGTPESRDSNLQRATALLEGFHQRTHRIDPPEYPRRRRR